MVVCVWRGEGGERSAYSVLNGCVRVEGIDEKGQPYSVLDEGVCAEGIGRERSAV